MASPVDFLLKGKAQAYPSQPKAQGQGHQNPPIVVEDASSEFHGAMRLYHGLASGDFADSRTLSDPSDQEGELEFAETLRSCGYRGAPQLPDSAAVHSASSYLRNVRGF